MSSTGQDLASTDATAQAPSAAEVSGLAAQLAGNAAITEQPSTSMVPDYTATDFSPPEAFIPTTASVPTKFDRNFLQKQQDLINSLGVTVNTGNAKVQTYLKSVKDRVDAAVASNAGLEAAFDIQEALVQGGFAEVKSALALLSERVEVVAS